MTISLRKLEIFIEIAVTGHATQAAEKLRLSQSAVSMALADLEKQHAGPLFHRRGRKLLLNDRGRLLLPVAQDILQRLYHFDWLLQDSAGEPVGKLLVGASTTIGNYLLPMVMASFSRRYPKAKIVLRVGNSEGIVEALGDGLLDLALIEGPCHRAHLEQHHWRDDQLVVIAGRDHPWTRGGMIVHDALRQGNWIIREAGSGTREVFEQAMGVSLATLPSVVEIGHTEAIKKAVEAGLGVSCLSRLAVQRELDHGWLVEIATALPLTRSLTVLLPPGGYRSNLLKACLDLLFLSDMPT